MVKPFGLFAEIRTVGSIRLLILFLDDASPRALRMAVIEPSSGWSFQMVALTDASPKGEVPYLSASPPRQEMLRLFQRKLSGRRSLPTQAKPPALASEPVVLRPARPAITAERPQDLFVGAPGARARENSVAVESMAAAVRVLGRETRFTDDDDVVLLTVLYDRAAGSGAVRLSAVLSDPASAKETRLQLANP